MRWRTIIGAALAALLLTGCEKAMQDMYRQPRYDALEPGPAFPDGRSARTPPPRSLAALSGGLAESSGGQRGTATPPPEKPGALYPLIGDPEVGKGAVTAAPDLPVPVTRATYARGRERFEIYCAPCHGPVGDGDGMVARRGYPAPPSYHTDRLRWAPDQYLYDVITQGYGAMYSYADRLGPNDRWAVVAYIRALQLSQHAPVSVLDEQDRARLGENGG